jgi:hypothetical protein
MSDIGEVSSMMKWVEDSGAFENDHGNGRCGMGRMVGVGLTKQLGWAQQEIFLPIKPKEEATAPFGR